MAQFDDSLNDVLDEIRDVAEHALELEIRVERGLSDQEFEAENWRKQIDFRLAVNRLYALFFGDADDIRVAQANKGNEWVSIKNLPSGLIGFDELGPGTEEFEVHRRAVEARTTTAREIVAAEKGEQTGRAL